MTFTLPAHPQTKVRLAKSKDAERIAILCEQLGYSATQQQIQERLAHIEQNEAHVVYVATLPNDYVIGWGHAHACDLIVNPKQAVLFGLVVDEDYRHSGIGRLFMQHIEQWASLVGCQGILIRSNIKRKEAHRFYEKIGYTNIKQSLTFCKELIF
ncbi:GNAT family N-acetyltransferase [Brasilonema sp. UFV-L1]|uniref:GNAT family N-acetyltransferase n=1 Tax=Brasilonema sp. UFV-L1 TaxID=2234130 RepID=UPI00145E3DC0|nr:GNAT family N-acetyltransferase [Brasilonema sp. UFV-L1]NMG08424.1 N-acetyltransferase [Brasilonema sp. UFV-L1]